jgi:hypothetical protein
MLSGKLHDQFVILWKLAVWIGVIQKGVTITREGEYILFHSRAATGHGSRPTSLRPSGDSVIKSQPAVAPLPSSRCPASNHAWRSASCSAVGTPGGAGDIETY